MTDNGGPESFASSTLTVGTWNVRSMNTGKINKVKMEMERIGIDVLGVTELRWRGTGYFNSNAHSLQ